MQDQNVKSEAKVEITKRFVSELKANKLLWRTRDKQARQSGVIQKRGASDYLLIDGASQINIIDPAIFYEAIRKTQETVKVLWINN